jgi:SAM-dependent methyltransferase
MRKLVLWGHHIDEYREMFDLSSADMKTRLLEYGCGPSAVNAELTALAQPIISCDPLFNLDKDTLYSKAALIFADMMTRMIRDKTQFDFSRYGSPELLAEERQKGMAKFFADYNKGKKEKRYIGISDYTLPFPDFSFDFALSSHYLFADLDDQDVDFHIHVIKELARVGKEVRIFPLIDRYNQPSPFLGPVLLALQEDNFGVEVREVAYHLQPSGNAMLRVWAQQCPV